MTIILSPQIADRFRVQIESLVKEVDGRIDDLTIAEVLQRAATEVMKGCLICEEMADSVLSIIETAKFELFDATLPDDTERRKQWRASRKAAGATVDVESCITWRRYLNISDPYAAPYLAGLRCDGIGRFVQSDQTDGPVWEGDLPEEKRAALRERVKREPPDEMILAVLTHAQGGIKTTDFSSEESARAGVAGGSVHETKK